MESVCIGVSVLRKGADKEVEVEELPTRLFTFTVQYVEMTAFPKQLSDAHLSVPPPSSPPRPLVNPDSGTLAVSTHYAALRSTARHL